MISELILKCRSYRRFFQYVTIPMDVLRKMVDNARLSASARNMQSLRFMIINSPEICEKVFPTLSWAGYLANRAGVPVEGERPSAYIIILNDNEVSTNYYCDHGVSSQSMLLTAVEFDFGGCIIASISRETLRQNLNIDEKYEIIHILALGKPKETVVIDPVGADGDIKYWRDAKGVHHVPKRQLDDLIISID